MTTVNCSNSNLYARNINFKASVPSELKNQANEEENPNNHTNYSTTSKVVMGVGCALALSALIFGGIKAHNHITDKRLNKQILETYKNIKSKFKTYDSMLSDSDLNINSTKEDFMQLTRLSNKNKAEKLKKLKEFKSRIKNIEGRGLEVYLTNEKNKVIVGFTESLPQNVKEAIQENNYEKAAKLYTQWCDTLMHKSKTAGATIEESVKKVFGEGSIVKPHTYDVTKEFDSLAMNNNTWGSGFQSRVVNTKNEIVDTRNWVSGKEFNHSGHCYSHGVNGYTKSELPIIQSGEHQGHKFVGLTYPIAENTAGNKIAGGITLLSPKGADFTPAQKDLMSIDFSKLSQNELDLIYKLPRDGEKANYDAVLSLIQTLAHKK